MPVKRLQGAGSELVVSVSNLVMTVCKLLQCRISESMGMAE
jgi:hypothetical protein